jgi:hypothetical protein
MHEESKQAPADCEVPQTGELPEQTGKEVTIKYRPSPSRQPFDRKIHPRQPAPKVPEGEEVSDEDPSSPVDLE